MYDAKIGASIRLVITRFTGKSTSITECILSVCL